MIAFYIIRTISGVSRVGAVETSRRAALRALKMLQQHPDGKLRMYRERDNSSQVRQVGFSVDLNDLVRLPINSNTAAVSPRGVTRAEKHNAIKRKAEKKRRARRGARYRGSEHQIIN